MLFYVLLTLLAIAAIRVRILSIPLERDEGEYACVAQLLSHGIPPYQLACNMKWPGTYFAYWVIITLFGHSVEGIHFGLLIVSSLTSLCVFFLARSFAGEIAGYCSVVVQALLALTPATAGFAAHATHFVILPALIGLLLLQKKIGATRGRDAFLAGIFIGIAALMKQAGALFVLVGIVQLYLSLSSARARARVIALFLLGFGTPLTVTAAYLYFAGVFPRFWLWTVEYAAAYATIITPREGLRLLASAVRGHFEKSPLFWGLGLLGLAVSFRVITERKQRIIFLALVGVSFLSVCPGWYFRGHYFLLFLPALGVSVGLAFAWLIKISAETKMTRGLHHASLLILILGASLELYANRALFFFDSPEEISRTLYGDNPFVESVFIGKFLSNASLPQAKIAVVGSEPQIYFYADRAPATSYLYTYALMEPQPYARQMQQEMIREIEIQDPDFVVFVHITTSWLFRNTSDMRFFDWFERYKTDRLDLLYLVQIADGKSIYTPNIAGATLTPKTDHWLTLYRKKSLRPHGVTAD